MSAGWGTMGGSMAAKTPSLIARLRRRNDAPPPSTRADATKPSQPGSSTVLAGSKAGVANVDDAPGVSTSDSAHSHGVPTPAAGHRDDVPAHSNDAPTGRPAVRRRRPAPARDLSLEHPRLREAIAETVHPWKGKDGLASMEDEIVTEALRAFSADGQYTVEGSLTRDGEPVVLPDSLVDQFLNRTEFAHRVDVQPATLSRYDLPAPDVLVGSGRSSQRGWRVSTVLAWDGARGRA